MTDSSQNEPGGGVPHPVEEPEIRLLDYWQILVRRRHVLLSCLAIVVVVTMTFTLLTAPTYRATATLEIQRYAPEVVEFTDVVNVDPGAYWDFHQTQQKLLQSRTVARIAAESLDLLNRPEFASREGTPIGRLLRWGRARLGGERPRLEPDIDMATAYVRGGLSISLIRNSYLAEVAFEDRDPTLAAEIANSVASAFQQFQLDTRYNTTGQAREFLTKDVARVQAEIETLEQELQAYGVEKEILALSDGTQDISEQALADINRRFTEAKARMASASARYDSIRTTPPEGLPQVLSSPVIGHLRQRHAELERRHSHMAGRFMPDWPPLVELREELDKAREQLETESETIAQHVRAAARAGFETAQAEYEALQRAHDSQKREVRRVSQDAIDYASLKTKIETKRKVLADLVTRESETETSYRLRETGTSNVRVVDQAEIPEAPFKPNKRLNLLLSILFGAGLGAALALLVDHLDNTVKSEQDIQQVGKLTVLGHVPLTRALTVAHEDPDRATTHQLDVASHLDPRSQFSETFRNLRTSLLLASPDHPPRHVLVTSCEPADGKSTVALNLAIVLTQQNRKVLLVDADLRRPRLHKSLNLENEVGLSSYLSGNASIEGVVRETTIPNLTVIPSGPIPPNPSELLGSPRLDALLEEYLAANDIDHLILDSPPLLSVADAIVLSARIEATVVVVRSGSTRKDALAQSASRLGQSRAHVVGAVLNAVSNESGYYRRYYRYRRYYGKDEDTPAAGASREKGSAHRRKAG